MFWEAVVRRERERERERATETFCGRLVQENIEDNPGGGKFLTYMPF